MFIKTFLYALVTLNIRVIVTLFFSFYAHEALLCRMFNIWSRVLVFIREKKILGDYLSLRISLLWTRMLPVIDGIQKLHSMYPVAWIMHYLSRDNSWDETSRRMRKNVLLPESLINFYRDMIYNYSRDQLTETFKLLPCSKRLTQLYYERQIRCGFTPLLTAE